MTGVVPGGTASGPDETAATLAVRRALAACRPRAAALDAACRPRAAALDAATARDPLREHATLATHCHASTASGPFDTFIDL
ncbi:hypothetical protein J2752_001400 [Halarchaeum rubridurum]|uniref:Uncharacterized protein n=1 Tax=Halarchaeum rubridurum TaxID=489911 RepID=A0A830FL63_9EURY|nr:hypothetical protein [Halarchaeum rubridurum]MBP1954488.1 hypothetical protein [Halarchaeum rubridurum]GGM61438.1 hypothetical protein GCM10009017_09440 [Halarchaeum rubridurum]